MLPFRRAVTSTIKFTRAGQTLRLVQGLCRTGNQEGVLYNTPDYSFPDGTPGLLSKGARRRIRREKRLLKRIEQEAAKADYLAKNGRLPAYPGIKKHRTHDSAFFYEDTPENIERREQLLREMKAKKKVPL